MKELLENKLFFVVILLGGLFVSNMVMVPIISKKVMEKFKSTYTPGPYQPGYNPDLVDPGSFKQTSPPPKHEQDWQQTFENSRD